MDAEPGTGRDAHLGDSQDEAATAVPAIRRQQPVPERIRALSTITDPGYVDLFTMTGGIPDRSPEQWARALFEDAAGRAGQFVWRVLLGLRLTASRDRVAGWQIAGRGADWIRLEARSWFLTGHLVVQADDEHVSLATFIRYDRPVAPRIWLPLAKKHRQLAPGLLRDAHRAGSRA
ncbi:hypothetical protein [Streptomyces bicolor]|uniref:hypothetical protein n=1 Tax=Streptomyces bicolor TaxID=66874 RepID=UPI0004E252D0|nr:hypothetical protein [Streptomyces bicolor]